MKNYKDYLNAEIERKLRNPMQFTQSEIKRFKHAKRIKRKDILDREVTLLTQ